MRIDLTRAFSAASYENEDPEDWLLYLRKSTGQYSWPDLLERRVVIVLGEAGIGKTLEFQNEVDRLQRENKTAFFIPLNLVDRDWDLVVSHWHESYEKWEKSDDTAYFFLDAVDEARLESHAAFERALMVIGAGLRTCWSRVRIVISSRITDWSVDNVRDSVRRHLVVPIEAASRIIDVGEIGEVALDAKTVAEETAPESVDGFVVSLDPLSHIEARKLADALGVRDATNFWEAVEDGDYGFMATRPLDLRWMVYLWNQKHSLGTYSELIEANVSNRLTDVNPSYQQTGASLSLELLRSGAEQLAAAAELSGRQFVSMTNSAIANELAPTAILSDWKPVEIARLLGSAVFDEATFGRVKFHHRSIREYLAASWVNQQLRLGLPLHRVLPLFSARPFGEPVLIPSRRATLCWLAALNVEVREWVTREFPEMLLFEGDPEAWDLVSADLAFNGYMERVKAGLRTDWWNNASEFRRVARRLPAGRIAGLLGEQQNRRVIDTLLALVEHGRLLDCGQAVFDLYRRPAASVRDCQHALIALAAVAPAEHRATIKEDLLQSRLASNELIAAALTVIAWPRLTVEELAQVFKVCGAESGYGSGPMARAGKEDLLPKADAASAELLLSAILAALPAPESGQRFVRFPESDQPERAWLLDVLSSCTERLLSLVPAESARFPKTCLRAAERVEAFRHSGFADEDELRQLHGVIAKRRALRWQIALEIARSEEIRHATNRLTWDGGCLVSFGKADLPELITRANHPSAPQNTRDVWFELGMNLAFRELKGRQRQLALAELVSGPEGESRERRVSAVRSEWLHTLEQNRKFKSEDRQRKQEKKLAHDRNRENLTHDLKRIRDGSYTGALHWLISYSHNHSGRNSLTRVDLDVISRDFGSAMADALASGLTTAWSQTVPPNPVDYAGGRVPWGAITGLAGLHVLVERGTDIASLSEEESAGAAQLSVWELNDPPLWFERLAATHESAVLSALHPWLEAECSSPTDEPGTRRTLELALRCSSHIRSRLLQPTVRLIQENRIANHETLKNLLNSLDHDGLIDANTVAAVCRVKVEGSLNEEGLMSELGWLRTWLKADIEGAWAWFENHMAGLGELAGRQVHELAEALVDGKWIRDPVSSAGVAVLVRVYRLLTTYLTAPGTQASAKETDGFGNPIARLRESIPGILVQVRGAVANRALVELAAAESNAIVKEWLDARVAEHAALEAQQFASIEPNSLRTLGAPYLSEPRSERELFQQALGRLQEIRKGVEEGPFSERLLFRLRIPEKHLQLWLAARFLDTTNRRFSVHREEVVDADNRTDIQLSCQYGNVCVEVKPLDSTRSYSASSLVDTLRNQMVGQYLKGLNSVHGIIVLFRLDQKSWAIPGKAKQQDFAGLVSYLRAQAENVKRDFPEIKELEVVGVDCLPL